MAELLFAISVFMILFEYIGYPFSLKVIAYIRPLSIKQARFYPFVSFIITVFNEEKRIFKKLQDTLSLDYPRDRFQIIVASDGSTDLTHDIVKSFEKDGVKLLVMGERGGKEQAQKQAVKHASGEILVFSDVATILDQNGVTKIVSNFSDSTVGCVSSEDRLISKNGNFRGEGAYVRYEMWLRRLESDVNSVVGLSGSFFAVRKEVCCDFSGHMQSDFRLLLSSVGMGYRGVSDPASLGYYLDIADSNKEFERKVRTVVRGLTVFFKNIRFLNPFKFGLFSYQLFCHKLLRWLIPFFLAIAFVTNAILAFSSCFFFALFVWQLAFYGIAIVEECRNKPFTRTILKIPGYFLKVNLAILLAWRQYASGHRIVMWTPSER